MRKINDATLTSFKSLLESAQWDAIHRENRPSYAYDLFFEYLDGSFDMAFPVIDVKPNIIACPLNPWMTPGLLRSRKHKEKLGSKKLRNPTDDNVSAYNIFNSV